MSKPILFIGSAKESVEIVDALEMSLMDCADVKRWDIGSFQVGEFSLESLLNQVATSDFAAFVLGQDDKTESRGKSQPSPRDNVIFEGGMFASTLGLKRIFFIVDSRGTKRPSDWDGLGYLTYFADRAEPRQRVLEAVQEMRRRIQERGPKTAERPTNALHGHWWQLVLNTDEGSVLSHMEINAGDPGAIRINGESWSDDGRPHATYRSRATSYISGDQVLCYSWEGEHTRQAGLPKYFGCGEIRFDFQKKEGRGYFSTTDGAAPPQTDIKQCVYLRASSEDLTILDDPEGKKRPGLAKKLLGKRKAFMT
jgi:hypothetical protein